MVHVYKLINGEYFYKDDKKILIKDVKDDYIITHDGEFIIFK